MQQKLLSLILIAGLLTVFGLAYVRSVGPTEAVPQPVTPDAMQSSSDYSNALSSFQIPKRPLAAVDSADAAPEIARLRNFAFASAESLVASFPGAPQPLALLGKLHLRARDAEGAKKLWLRALELDPRFAEAQVDLGFLEQNLDHLDQAEGWFRRAVKNEPQNTAAHRALADVLLRQGKFDEAANSLRVLLEREPEAADVWCRLGETLQAQGDTEGAINSYGNALKFDKTSRPAAQGLMIGYRQQGNRQRADEFAKLFAELDSSYVVPDEDRGAIDLQKMQDLTEYVVLNAADTWMRRESPAKALQLMQQAHALIPDSRTIATRLAELLVHTGLSGQALAPLQRLAKLRPDDKHAWGDLARLAIELRRLDEAEAALQKLLVLDPLDATAHALIAQTQMPAERSPEQAVKSATRAVELSPTAYHHYILATAHYHAGDHAAAATELRNAIQIDPRNKAYRDALMRLEQ